VFNSEIITRFGKESPNIERRSTNKLEINAKREPVTIRINREM